MNRFDDEFERLNLKKPKNCKFGKTFRNIFHVAKKLQLFGRLKATYLRLKILKIWSLRRFLFENLPRQVFHNSSSGARGSPSGTAAPIVSWSVVRME